MDTNPARLTHVLPPPRPALEGGPAVPGLRPRLVVAHPNAAYVALTQRHFRRLGWDVHAAATADEARQLTASLHPMAVVLGTELPGETGWLTCSKLLCDHPGLKVILVAADRSAVGHRFAEFVGAARLVSEADGVAALVDEVYDTALAAAG